MADRYDLPKIKPEGQPSLINHGAGVGAFWGFLAGGVASIAVPQKFKVAVKWGGAALGGFLGGTQEKSQQEREQTEGRVVKTPGYWNKGIISGLMVTEVVAAPILAFTKVKAGTLGGLALIGGMVAGSVMRKNELKHDFDRAVAVRDEETNALRSQLRASQIANGTSASYMNSVSAPEAAELAAKQERTSPVAEKVHADRAHHEAEAAR